MRQMAKNITSDFDRHSILVMYVKLFDTEFKFIFLLGTPVIHLNVTVSNHASNAQCSHENPNGREQDKKASMHE